MPSGECGAADHDLDGSSGGTATHQTASLSCRKCGVGHTIDIRYLAPQKIQVDLRIFPAHGRAADKVVFAVQGLSSGDGGAGLRGLPVPGSWPFLRLARLLAPVPGY